MTIRNIHFLILLAFSLVTPSWAGDTSSYLKLENTDTAVRLHVGVKVLKPTIPGAPVVTLYGLQHVGDREFYTALNEAMKPHDLVLYESLRPFDVDPRVALDDRGRKIKSEIAIRCLKVLLERHRKAHGSYPPSLEACLLQTPEEKHWLSRAASDGWGHDLVYERSPEGDSVSITCLGSDGKPGGDGVNADFDFNDQIGLLSNETGIFSYEDPRPNAIGLYSQSHVFDTRGQKFLRSDVCADHLAKWITREGGDWNVLKKNFESQVGGQTGTPKDQLSEARKKQLVGMLERTAKAYHLKLMPTAKLPPALKAMLKVMVDERNQLVVDDLKSLLKGDTPYKTPKSVAITYGAGHMMDLEARLKDQLGYTDGPFTWMTCVDVAR